MSLKKLPVGQAAVETVIVLPLITIICFVAFQVGIMIINDLISMRACFAAARSAALEPSDIPADRENTAHRTALTHLASRLGKRSFLSCTTELKDIAEHEPEAIQLTLTSTMKLGFRNLIDPSHDFTTGVGGTAVAQRTVHTCLMHSPDPDYYRKGYPNAPEF